MITRSLYCYPVNISVQNSMEPLLAEAQKNNKQKNSGINKKTKDLEANYPRQKGSQEKHPTSAWHRCGAQEPDHGPSRDSKMQNVPTVHVP